MSEVEILRALEERLLDNTIRKDALSVSQMLAENFKEFGASGRVYSKQEIIAFLALEENFTPPVMEGFNVELQTSDVAVVTYRAVRKGECSLRSSIWIRNSNSWQMLFHQGTKTNLPQE